MASAYLFKKDAWQNWIQKYHPAVMMVLCFLPLIVGIIGTVYFGWQRSYIVWIFLLLCPLMHYWVVKKMDGKKKKSCH